MQLHRKHNTSSLVTFSIHTKCTKRRSSYLLLYNPPPLGHFGKIQYNFFKVKRGGEGMKKRRCDQLQWVPIETAITYSNLLFDVVFCGNV